MTLVDNISTCLKQTCAASTKYESRTEVRATAPQFVRWLLKCGPHEPFSNVHDRKAATTLQTDI